MFKSGAFSGYGFLGDISVTLRYPTFFFSFLFSCLSQIYNCLVEVKRYMQLRAELTLSPEACISFCTLPSTLVYE